MDGLLDSYMEDSRGVVERFSFDKFMLDEEREWRGPFWWNTDDG